MRFMSSDLSVILVTFFLFFIFLAVGPTAWSLPIKSNYSITPLPRIYVAPPSIEKWKIFDIVQSQSPGSDSDIMMKIYMPTIRNMQMSQYKINWMGQLIDISTELNFELTYALAPTFVYAHNVYTHIHGYRIVGDTIYGPVGPCSLVSKLKYFNFSGEVKGEYDQIINLGESFSCVYGHFFSDFIPFLELLPSEEISRSHFIFEWPTAFHEALLSVYDVPPSNIHYASSSDLIFAHRYIGLTRRYCVGNFPTLLLRFRQRVFKKLAVVESCPFRRVIYDRSDWQRFIYNLLELLEEIQDLNTEGVWELLGDIVGIKQIVDVYYSVSMYFYIHGSVYPNLIFLHPHAVVCEYDLKQNRRQLIPSRSPIIAANAQCIVVHDFTLSRYFSWVKLNQKKVVQCVKYGLSLLPSNEAEWEAL